jgi:flagellar assembly factor FliW
MPQADTRHFGTIQYQEADVIHFPRGLPGFDQQRRFLPLAFPHTHPLIFLQSIEDPGLCFITLPVLAADPSYRLELAGEDLALIGLPRRPQPRIGEDVLCVVVLSIREDGPTANLLAPLVVNLRNRLGVQAVSQNSRYSHRHPLGATRPAAREAVAC